MTMTIKEKASYEKHKRVIALIRQMHIKSNSALADSMCQECCSKWPCPTLKACDSRA